MSKVLGSGVVLKKEGWLIIVYHKPGEEMPKVTIRRVKEED
jgi:hypothetical protein